MTTEKNTVTCLNCDNEFEKEFDYCPHCGQKNTEVKLDLKYLISDFLSGSFNIDSKFWISFKYLITKPSYLSLEFLKGRRASYLSPIRMYLLVSLAYFAALSLDNSFIKINENNKTKNDSIPNVVFDNEAVSLGDTTLRSKKLVSEFADSTESIAGIELDKLKSLNTKEGRNKFDSKFSDFFSGAMFFVMPVAAFLLYLFYGRRRKGYYFENLIFFIHLQSLIFLILSVFYFLEWITTLNFLVDIGVLLVLFFSVIWIKKFYLFKWVKAVFATLGFIFSYLIVLLLAFAITAYISLLIM